MINLVRKETSTRKDSNGNILNSEIESIEIERNNVNWKDDLLTIDPRIYNIHNIVKNFNNGKCSVYRKCLMLMPKEKYLASDEEVERARKIFVNAQLKFPDHTYLKDYETKYENFKDLYSEVEKWKKEYVKKGIFATHTFSRKTMYTEEAKLGIKPIFRDKIMYCPQYSISAEKRIHMINYTLINEQNGFWYKIPRSQHGIPYLMVPKRNSNGVIMRYRHHIDQHLMHVL